MKFEWLVHIDEGRLDVGDADTFKASLKYLAGDYVLKLEKPKQTRSGGQNRYYWGVVVNMVRDALMEKGHDYSPDEVHEAMKWKFLQKHEEGIELPTVRSTTGLNTTEFEEYAENIRRWAAEYLEIVIPEPNQEQFL